ncbi:MAG: hypothetical protein K9M98_03870 [Cephaloticoccus sp.]|nr:hypothetical protein [Cephaloticoccus sp.]MCF7759620.1 hypothetical protein [Cephaloticoccus sp.]
MKFQHLIFRLLAVLAGGFSAQTQAASQPADPANDGREAWVMHFDSDWRIDGTLPEKAMLIGLQGLANRTAPQLYLIHAADYPWEITGPLADFYTRKHGVKFTEIQTADEALELFGSCAKGYVVWDPAVMPTMNVAYTIAGLEDGVIVTPALIPMVVKHGLKQIDDLRGRYTGMTDAQIYAEAKARYWSRCNHDMLMLMGGHSGDIRIPGMADWGVRQRMFFHDLSANPEHPDEVALEKEFFSEMNPGAFVFGWHSYAKDTEEQHTTLTSTYGLRMDGLQSLPNHSFNCQFTFTPGFKFTNQHHVKPDTPLIADKKVYLAFVQSDGIGLGVWTKPGRGRLELSWGAIPSWLEFAPAALEYFHESATPADYFIGGLSGPSYMYPNHIPADRFAGLMQEAVRQMEVLDENVFEILDNSAADGNVGNADLTQETVDRYYEAFPNVIGFINGYGPARTRDLRNGVPMISYDYYIDPRRPREEVTADLNELMSLNAKRPYFLLVHVRETNDVNSLVEVIKNLAGPVEVVPVDTFMKLAASKPTFLKRYQDPEDPKKFEGYSR